MAESGSGLQQSSLPEWKGCRAQRKGRDYVWKSSLLLHPEIRRKRTSGKGFLYHISAAGMALKSERDAADTLSRRAAQPLDTAVSHNETGLRGINFAAGSDSGCEGPD